MTSTFLVIGLWCIQGNSERLRLGHTLKDHSFMTFGCHVTAPRTTELPSGTSLLVVSNLPSCFNLINQLRPKHGFPLYCPVKHPHALIYHKDLWVTVVTNKTKMRHLGGRWEGWAVHFIRNIYPSFSKQPPGKGRGVLI